MHTGEPVKEINITFTEEDRQKASYFTDNINCLVGTALKRMGYKKTWSYIYTHQVDGFLYNCPDTQSDGLYYIPHSVYSGRGPHYRPEVVGKQVTLTLHED